MTTTATDLWWLGPLIACGIGVPAILWYALRVSSFPATWLDENTDER